MDAGVAETALVHPWMISSADAVMPLVEGMNQAPRQYGAMVCHDVEQLYTNIDHTDIRA